MDWNREFSLLFETIIKWLQNNCDIWMTFIIAIIVALIYFKAVYIKKHLPEDIRIKLELKEEKINYYKNAYIQENKEVYALKGLINELRKIKILEMNVNQGIKKENLK